MYNNGSIRLVSLKEQVTILGQIKLYEGILMASRHLPRRISARNTNGIKNPLRTITARNTNGVKNMPRRKTA